MMMNNNDDNDMMWCDMIWYNVINNDLDLQHLKICYESKLYYNKYSIHCKGNTAATNWINDYNKKV